MNSIKLGMIIVVGLFFPIFAFINLFALIGVTPYAFDEVITGTLGLMWLVFAFVAGILHITKGLNDVAPVIAIVSALSFIGYMVTL